MNALFRPLWVFAAVTVPQLLLIGAGAGTLRIVGSQLTEQHLRSWAIYGGLLALLLASFTAVALRALRARRPLPRRLGPALLAGYLPLLSALALRMGELVPPSIPRWMLFHGDQLALAITLLMPALMYGLFLTVGWLTPDTQAASLWKSFAGAVALPLGWYLLCTAGADRWQGRTLETAVAVLALLSAVAFLFFVVRAAHVAVARKTGALQRLRPLWVAVVSIVFPLLGLALHGGLILGGSLPRGPFGDFSHPAFYALAALNGVLLCLPSPARAVARWGLACGRALLLPFTVYFFLVFLPYFPLSVFAVFAFGLGFLMLTPLVLMVLHAGALREDFATLGAGAGVARSAAALLAAALLLPALIVAGFLRDRAVLHGALDYVQAPDYSAPEQRSVDAASLRRVLSHVRTHKGGSGREFLNEHVPYLSPLYQRLVLGRLTLADATMRELEAVFFGASAAAPPDPRPEAGARGEVVISRASATSAPTDGGRALVSAVELEITNTGSRTQEYASSFGLPEHAWVGGLHLRIGDRDEPGILADSRAAAWVYRRIVSTRRDPGILYRQPNGRFAIRVFPLAAGETRRAGFEIVHREPFALRIGGKELLLGEGREPASATAVVPVGGGEVHYVPQAVKQRLPAVTRTPVLHFLVDCSAAAAHRRADFIRRIKGFMARAPIGASSVRFTLVDFAQTSFEGDVAWQRRVREHEGAGGFFLGRSVKSILRQQYVRRSATYPILIVVTDALERALVPGGLADFSFTAPEADALYRLGPGGELASYRFAGPDRAGGAERDALASGPRPGLPGAGAPVGLPAGRWRRQRRAHRRRSLRLRGGRIRGALGERSRAGGSVARPAARSGRPQGQGTAADPQELQRRDSLPHDDLHCLGGRGPEAGAAGAAAADAPGAPGPGCGRGLVRADVRAGVASVGRADAARAGPAGSSGNRAPGSGSNGVRSTGFHAAQREGRSEDGQGAGQLDLLRLGVPVGRGNGPDLVLRAGAEQSQLHQPGELQPGALSHRGWRAIGRAPRVSRGPCACGSRAPPCG